MKNNNGGPAYPTRGGMMFYIPEKNKDSVKEAIEELDRDFDGMSLRDYFAGQAVIGVITKWGMLNDPAKKAYSIADEMLAERER